MGADQDAKADAPLRAALLEQLQPGLVIAEKYRIEETLGRGAMGVVVAARHLALDERVALKFLLLDDGAQQFRSRFAREARVCAKLRNEHVVRVTDFGVYRDVLAYMVMDCLEGADLRTTLQQRGGKLDVDVAVEYAVQVCEGLAEVHAKGIVHRDLKPSNLFVTARADGSTLIKIVDFGISKWVDPRNVGSDAELTETGVLLGTPKFMPPEQLFGATTIDARADVWSIGAIVYVMLTGRAPFEAPTFATLCARLATGEVPEPPSALRAEVPAALDAVVLAALRHRLDERTVNVAELAGDLLAAIGAPAAEDVRARLRTALGGSSSSTGDYVPARADVTGSIPRIKSASATGSIPGTTSAPRMLLEEEVRLQRERRTRIWLVAATVLATAGALSLLGRRSEPRPVAEPVAAASSPLPRPSIEAPLPAAPSSTPSVVHNEAPAASTSGPALAVAKRPAILKVAEPIPPPPPPSPSASQKPALKTLLGDRQ